MRTAPFTPEQIAKIIDTALAGDWLPTLGQHRVDVGLIPKPLWWGSLLSFKRDTGCKVVDAKRARRRHLDLAAAHVTIKGRQFTLLPDTLSMLGAMDAPRDVLFPWYRNGSSTKHASPLVADFRQILRAAKLPIVPRQLFRGFERSVETHWRAGLSPVTVTIPDVATDVDVDPMGLVAEWVDVAGLHGSYRQKNVSRLQSMFMLLDVYRVRDIEPGLFARFLADEVKRGRLTSDTASLYRVAALGFVRWLVVAKRLWHLGRVVAELDAARVGQCAIVRKREKPSGRPFGRPRKVRVTA